MTGILVLQAWMVAYQLILKDTHKFEFNNIDSLYKLFNKYKFAAVIIEPLSVNLPEKKFLNKVQGLCKKIILF